MRWARSAIKDDKGFTLIELVISLALLAAMAVLMTSALRFGTRGWANSHVRVEAVEEVAAVRSFLERQLSQAYPLLPVYEDNLLGEQRPKYVPLQGRRDSVIFASVMPAPWGQGGLYWLALYEDRDKGERVLKFAWTPFEGQKTNPRTDSKAVEAILVSGIKDFDIDYLYRDPQTKKTRWRAAWLNETTLPELIRVSLSFEDEAYVWPPLVIKPMITIDATCVFDSISRRCRKVVG